jgi:hypothetical protein
MDAALPSAMAESYAFTGAEQPQSKYQRSAHECPGRPVDRPATGPDPDHLPTASRSSAGSLNQ